jgi:hypothetical protein
LVKFIFSIKKNFALKIFQVICQVVIIDKKIKKNKNLFNFSFCTLDLSSGIIDGKVVLVLKNSFDSSFL